MPDGQSLYQRLGSLSLPPDLGAIGEARTLTALDPARRILADLFKAAINAELAEAWVAAVSGRLGEKSPISPELPVADVLELEPNADHMRERQGAFPLMSVYRSGTGTYEQQTLQETKLRQTWMVDWILGPADLATKFQLGDTAVAVSKIIALVIERRMHPAYQSGAFQFGLDDGTSGITSLKVVRHIGPGVAKFAEGSDVTSYWAITIELESLEVSAQSGADGAVAGIFGGADYDVGIGGDETIHGLFYGNTDPVLQRS